MQPWFENQLRINDLEKDVQRLTEELEVLRAKLQSHNHPQYYVTPFSERTM